MTMALGTNTGIYYKAGAIATDPAPRAGRNFTLSATVDAEACELQCVHYAGCGGIRFSKGGVNWVNTPASHGQGIHLGADNIYPAGYTVAQNIQSPTQGGSQRDGTSVLTGTTNVPYLAVSSDNRRAVMRFAPAYWCQPNQDLIPTVFALNKTLVSDMVCTVDLTWGWNGDDHIIQVLRDVVVPERPYVAASQELDCVTLSVYGASAIFDTLEYLVPATGATRAYPGFPDTSNTETVMMSSADGTKAMAPFHPLGEWGPTGYAQNYTDVGLTNSFIRCREVVVAPASIPTGTRRYNAYMVFGTRAQVIASIQALDAANITRSTDIVLPDVA